MSRPTDEIRDVKERMYTIGQKYDRLKQQQFIFTTALGRSREHARDKIEPVSTVTQIQNYMNHHCSNDTDRGVFLLFMEIMSDLEDVFNLLDSSSSIRNTSEKVLETCRELLDPNSNISQLRAHYPHNEVNRLSCVEARKFYGGIMSVIPLALDQLNSCCESATQPLTSTATNTSSQQTETEETETSVDVNKRTSHNSSGRKKVTGGWHAGKPTWKPPGNTKR